MASKRRAARWGWYVAFAVIFAGALWVPFYNSVEPRLAGIPFFYWFQTLWIVVTAVITGLAYRARW